MANFQICIDLTNVDGNVTSAVRISQTGEADAVEIRRFGEFLEKVYRVMRDFDSYVRMDASALALRSKVSQEESDRLSGVAADVVNHGARGVKKTDARRKDSNAEQEQE